MPAIYSNVTFTLTASNTGLEDATGVVVDFPVPAGLAFVGQNASKGIYSNWQGNWEIGSLDAGETATLELTLFILTSDAISLFAQVDQQNETDADSSPGNGTCCIALEDDEAVVTINGNSNTGPDLELSIKASENSFSAWQVLSMTLTLQNTGNEAATDIVVDFPQPAGTVFQGGNEYTASQGIYHPYSPQQWIVGDLAAGAMATITFNLFTLQDSDPLNGYAQVLSLNETDSDSSPGNGSCCTANEDDEAVITLLPVPNGPAYKRPIDPSSTLLALRHLFPNPVFEKLTLVIESPGPMPAQLELYNSHGQLIRLIEVSLLEGINDLSLEVGDLPSGLYFIYFPEANASYRQWRFVKEGFVADSLLSNLNCLATRQTKLYFYFKK